MLERVTRAIGAINALNVYCGCYTVILAASQTHLYHVSDLLTSIVNMFMICPFIITTLHTPKPLASQL